MITAGLLLTAVAHPGMLFPNEILDSPVPADILNDSWSSVNETSLRVRNDSRLLRNGVSAYQNNKHGTASKGCGGTFSKETLSFSA